MSNLLVDLTIMNRQELISATALYLSSFLQSEEKIKKHACFVIEDILEYRLNNLQKYSDTVHVQLFEEALHYNVVISDKGLPYTIDGLRKKAFENGLVDDYVLEQHGSAGQSVSLYFRFSENKKEFVAPEITEEKLLDTNFTCRLLNDTDEDMLEAIKCLYSAYGFDYLHEDLYFFDSFRRKLNSGWYWSIVCENEHHQIVGHCSMCNDSSLPGIPEFCCLVTKPFARGNGIADRMLDFAENFANEKQFEGIVIYPVVYHPFTQKISNKHGYLPIAMHPSMASPAARGIIYQQGDLRGAEVISAKLMNKPYRTVYLPTEYEAYIVDTLNKLGVPFTVSHEKKNDSSTTSIYSTVIHSNTQTAFIYIDDVGTDFEAIIENFFKNDVISNIEMVGLYVNINRPSLEGQYELFRQHGFSFSGIIPGSTKGDYIYMQWFKKTYPLESMILEPNFKKMVDIICDINEKNH